MRAVVVVLLSSLLLVHGGPAFKSLQLTTAIPEGEEVEVGDAETTTQDASQATLGETETTTEAVEMSTEPFNITKEATSVVPFVNGETTTNGEGETTTEISQSTSTTESKTASNTATTTTTKATTTTTSGKIRECTCDEEKYCRDESSKHISSCFTQCHAKLAEFGGSTYKYATCFDKNPDSVVLAQNCLYNSFNNTCDNRGRFLNDIDEGEYSSFDFLTRPHKLIRQTDYLKKPTHQYIVMQNFLHCTKHCTNSYARKCFASKGCTLNYPSMEDYEQSMVACTRQDWRITSALFLTCTCMAYTEGVTDLALSCAVIGNQLFVDNV